MIDKFMKAMHRLHKNQRGMTGLETAIILIAFVTVASVFGYAVLSAGIFSAEKGKETVYAGLEQAKSSMELKGSVIATSSDNSTVDSIKFVVANAIAGKPIDLTAPPDNKTIIAYSDTDTYKNNVAWTVNFIGSNDGDILLEKGEQAEITVDVASGNITLEANDVFCLQVKPPHGSVLTIERTIPANIDTIMDLY